MLALPTSTADSSAPVRTRSEAELLNEVAYWQEKMGTAALPIQLAEALIQSRSANTESRPVRVAEKSANSKEEESSIKK